MEQIYDAIRHYLGYSSCAFSPLDNKINIVCKTKEEMLVFVKHNEFFVASWDSEEAANIVQSLAKFLRAELKYDVFYAREYFGEILDAIPSLTFTSNVIQKLNDAGRYILIYPEKLGSNCLVEAGWALAQGKMCVIFCKDKKDIPFMLDGSMQQNIIAVQYTDIEDIKRKMIPIDREFFNNDIVGSK